VFRKRHPLSFWCAVHDTSLGGESPLWRFVIAQPLAEDMGVHCEVESEGVAGPDNLDSMVISFELL